MSKIFNSALLTALVEMGNDSLNGELSPEDEQIYISLVNRKDNISKRFNDLSENIDSLDKYQLEEFKELKAFCDEYNELRVQKMSKEEIQNVFDRMSTLDTNNMPMTGKLWFETLRKVCEQGKTR